MVEVKEIESRNLSTFRTRHRFRRFGEFSTVEQFLEYRRWANENGIPLYILGNGSNTLFTRRRVRTLVLRNRLEAWMKDLGGGRIEVSSSKSVMSVLKLCEAQGLDSFYFMASVPATIGGAIAMNAGGAHETVFDFLESVTYVDGDRVITVPSEQVERSHRQTTFTGVQDRFIISAVFRFPERRLKESEIRKRIEWCHAHQDLSAPNCGSVFREYYGPLLRWMRRMPPGGIRYPILHAQFSRKVNNWIINKSPDSRSIVLLIRIVQVLHRLIGKRARPELIEVD